MTPTDAIRNAPLDLTPIGVFVRVVQARSFNAAAGQLGMPNSTVSAQVSRLERRLGVTLLHRTTRKLQLTDAGHTYFELVSQGVTLLQGADAAVSALQLTPKGLVRITTPSDLLPASRFAEMVSQFRDLFPDIDLEIDLTQRIVDLTTEGFDLGLRVGQSGHSRLLMRRIGDVHGVPVASPAYLARHGAVMGPDDLDHHRLLDFHLGGSHTWRLQSTSGVKTIALGRQTTINHIGVIKELVLGAQGIALLPTFHVLDEVRSGDLVRIMPDWSAASEPIYAIHPEQAYVPARVRVFLDFAALFFRNLSREGEPDISE